MQTRTLLAALTAAAIAAVVTPARSNAQDTTTSKGEVAMRPNFGSLISAINQVTDVRLKLVRVQVGVAHRYPNLLRALHSFLAILQPHVVPEGYRDI